MKYFEIETQVRYSECDAMGIVHHRNYFTWLEMARFSYIKAAGIDFHQLECEGILFPVIKAECNYRKPAKFSDDLIIQIAFIPNKAARIDFKYKIYNKVSRELIATAKTSQAITAPKKGMLLQCPSEFIEKLSCLMEN